MSSHFKLENQTIALVGAGGLLGQAFAKALANHGANLALIDSNPKAIETLQAELGADRLENQKFSTYQADITSKASIADLIKNLDSDFGRIDTLVNNAYPRNKNYGRRFFDVEYEDFCENLGLHLGGYFLTTQKFGEYFKDRGQGNIVNVSSIYGVIAPKFEVYEGTDMTMPVEYSAIKAGLIHLTKYTAKYLGPDGVRANCLSPGGIENGQNPDFISAYNKFCGKKGMLKPTDMTGPLCFLCSDASDFMNGQNLIIDDGFTL